MRVELERQESVHEIHYSYDAAPTLGRFAADERLLRLVMGPFGSGKTSACVMEFVRRGQLQEPLKDGIRHTRFLAVRNTYRQLRDTTMNTVFQWLPPKYFGEFNKSDFTYRINRIPGLDIEILFRALDRPEHVQNLLSLELTGAFVNEIRELRWAIIEALIGRVGRFPAKNQGGCTWKGIWGDTNPPPRTHWIYRRFEEVKPPDSMALYRQPSGLDKLAENLRWLPDNYYHDLEGIMDPESARVYVHAEYGVIRAGKPVFPQFNEKLHVSGDIKWEPRAKGYLWRGWDFGLTPACVIAQEAPNGQVQVLCELTTERAGLDIFADEVIRECAKRFPQAKFRDVADPAGKSGLPMTGKQGTNVLTCYEILNGKGIFPEDGDNSINMRLDAVRYGLRTLTDNGQPLLLVHRHEAPMIRDGLAGAYHYREIVNIRTVGEKYADEPEKNEYSHPMDALQYICELVFGFLVRKQRKQPTQAFQDPTDAADVGELESWPMDDEDPGHELQEFQYD